MFPYSADHIEQQRAESRELDHNIARLRNDLEKLNGLLFKESDCKELVAQDTALLETDFVLRLKVWSAIDFSVQTPLYKMLIFILL